MTHHSRIALAFMFLSVAVPGCNSEPSRYVVAGTVTMDGAPAPKVIVSFVPVESDISGGGIGVTDEAGKFTIGEELKNAGLTKGDYKVTFSQTLVKGKPTLSGSGGKASEKDATEKEAVDDDYRNSQKTPVTATIKGGTNTFTFEIKAKK
jgi:hypothetical protein